MVGRLSGPAVRSHLYIHFSAASASVAIALLLGRSWLLYSRRARSAAHWKSRSSFHGFKRAPAVGDGMARSLVESGGLRASSDAYGHVAARRLFASGCVSAGRTRH